LDVGAVGATGPDGGAGVPDPTGEADGQIIVTDDGAFVFAPLPTGAGIPATTVVDETALNGTEAAVGTGEGYAREDHTHGTPPMPSAAQVGADPVGTADALAETLADVATSGDYNDLDNLPTLGTAAATAATDYATAAQGALAAAAQPIAAKGQPDGYASLDSGGTVPLGQIPDGIARDSEVAAAVSAAVDALLDGAPGALDTLAELAAAVGDDADFAATVTTALSGKQPLNSDLTAIAALTTTSYGRSVLEWASASAGRTALELGTAATTAATAYATSAQGETADTAVQPEDLAEVATSGAYGDLAGLPTLGTAAAQPIEAFATSTQGDTADSAIQPTDTAADLARMVPTTAAGTTYTLALVDDLNTRIFTAAGAVTVTLPAAADVDLGAGFEALLHYAGAATLTLDATDVSFEADEAPKVTVGPNEALWVKLTGTADVWVVLGGTS
jgi:hypothetical protein